MTQTAPVWRHSSNVKNAAEVGGATLEALADMGVLLGRLLQLIGMLILPIALMVGMVRGNVALEVRLLFIGGAIFVLGWLMARRPE